MKPELLPICPLFPATMAQLDAADSVHRYYEAADKAWALILRMFLRPDRVLWSGGE